MKKLYEGLTLFQRLAYPAHKELFERLAKNQSPQAVFITCSDSRIVPNLLVQAEPGDLFILRNAGNIVPPATVAPGGTIASLEYAVRALGIRAVVLCGHSNCGAMSGILHPESVESMPAVRSWVRHAEPALRAVRERFPEGDGDEVLDALVELNVVAQLRNVLTHGFVRALVEAGELELFGWVYDIASGTVKGLDAEGRRFSPIGAEGTGSPDERKLLASLEGDEAFWERL